MSLEWIQYIQCRTGGMENYETVFRWIVESWIW